MLDTPAESLLGKPLADALPLEDLNGRGWWQCLRPYDGLATRTGHRERNLLLPGGREVLVAARYVRDRPAGRLTRLVVSLRDTRSRAREETSRAELISTVAHELRTPADQREGLHRHAAGQVGDGSPTTSSRLMLETVDADADRVTRLIAELLDIARIDSGRMEVHRQLVDLPAFVAGHIAGFRRPRRAGGPLRAAGGRRAARAVGRRRQGAPGAGQPAGKRGASRRRHCHDRHRAGPARWPTGRR